MKYLIYVVGFVVVILDQLLKITTSSTVVNSGYALGIMNSAQSGVALLNFCLLLGIAIFNIVKARGRFVKSLLWLVVIIGSSNLVDRIRLGYVVDYLHLGPIFFNLADIGLCFCVILILGKLLYHDSKSTS